MDKAEAKLAWLGVMPLNVDNEKYLAGNGNRRRMWVESSYIYLYIKHHNFRYISAGCKL